MDTVCSFVRIVTNRRYLVPSPSHHPFLSNSIYPDLFYHNHAGNDWNCNCSCLRLSSLIRSVTPSNRQPAWSSVLACLSRLSRLSCLSFSPRPIQRHLSHFIPFSLIIFSIQNDEPESHEAPPRLSPQTRHAGGTLWHAGRTCLYPGKFQRLARMAIPPKHRCGTTGLPRAGFCAPRLMRCGSEVDQTSIYNII
jgi:hypothetical protein